VRPGVADQRLAARVCDDHGIGHGVVRMAAQNQVDACHARGKFQVDIHAVVR
jgi:hypothetical protein